MKRIAVYSGTFDPFTLGHLWIVQEAQSLFDEVHVVIAGHPKKSPHFNLRTRSHMMTHALEKMERVQCYVLQEDNIVEHVHKMKRADGDIVAIIRGIRTDVDFEYEKKILRWCRRLTDEPWIRFDFFVPPDHLNHISSTKVKEWAAEGRWQDVQDSVPPFVYEKMKELHEPRCVNTLSLSDHKMQLEDELSYLARPGQKINIVYFGKLKDYFNAAVKNGFFQYADTVSSDQVREMLDPYPEDLVVSEVFHLKEIAINCVRPTGSRYLPASQSLGPIIVEANEVLGDKSFLGPLGPAIIIEGKHRWLDAKERGEFSIKAWVGEKALPHIKTIPDEYGTQDT